MTVAGDAGDKTFKLENSAKITVGTDHDAKIDNLKTGTKVSVEFKKEGDQSIAKSVQAQEPPKSDEKK